MPDPEDKFNKELKSVAEEDALRKLLSSDEEDEDENKSEHDSEKEEKQKKEREDLKDKKKSKKSKPVKKGLYKNNSMIAFIISKCISESELYFDFNKY